MSELKWKGRDLIVRHGVCEVLFVRGKFYGFTSPARVEEGKILIDYYFYEALKDRPELLAHVLDHEVTEIEMMERGYSKGYSHVIASLEEKSKHRLEIEKLMPEVWRKMFPQLVIRRRCHISHLTVVIADTR